ncbi:MAG: helix-turn-helix domain-containing protein [Chromatiales bacterium]|jgi:DNA-binding HxlR family transcriptional regulator
MPAKKDQQTTDDCQRSRCPVSSFLDILGDKWTLLVVRDLFFGKHTFKELQASLEKIPSNILADRLKRLEAQDIITRELYQERPKRYGYHLTDKGKELKPVMRSLIEWSNKYIPCTYDVKEIEKRLPKE